MEWIEANYNVNGYEVQARYTKENEELIFKPLISIIEKIARDKKKIIFVFLAAPPACGKSTLVKYLCDLGKAMGYQNMQWIGMDGFHYSNEYLKANCINGESLHDIKGCPESFNLQKLIEYIQLTNIKDCDWPVYDRNLHEPREFAIHIHSEIILLEGNYLLLDEERWRELSKLCDYSIFISAKEEHLSKRLIERKAKGMQNKKDAIHFYERSDKKNIQRVLSNRMDADLNLQLDAEGVFHKMNMK